MAVHVGEIHTELSGSRAHGADETESDGEGAPAYLGVHEDEWRGIQDRVGRLRRRVCAKDFDD